MKKVLIIIPAYNEELNIEDTVKKIQYLKIKNWQLDYVVINDGSSDRTELICRKKGYKMISLIQNLGIGGAVQTGYKYAFYNGYDIAIQFDGDGQHDENYIEKLIKEIESGFDFVIGSRYINDLSKFKSTKTRIIGKNIISFFIKIFYGIKIYDPTSGFRAANKDVIELFAKNYPIEYPEPESICILKKKNFRISEIPVEMHERLYGESSIKPLKSVYYMFSVCLSILSIAIFERVKNK